MEFTNIIEKLQLATVPKQFDCIVLTNGSRESVFLIHQLVQVHQLRCLVVYQQHPFLPKQIDLNLQHLFEEWRLPFIKICIAHEYHRKLAREMVRTWCRNKDQRFLEMGCLPCKLINRELFKIAQATEISTIFYGQVPDQFALPEELAESNNSSPFIDIDYQYFLKNDNFKLYAKLFLLKSRSKFFFDSPNSMVLKLVNPAIHAYNYFDYQEWDEKHCRKTLNEIGWQLPEHYLSSIKAHCTYAEVLNLASFQFTDLTMTEILLTHYVRKGYLTRDDAIAYIQKEGRVSRIRIRELARDLKISENYFFPAKMTLCSANTKSDKITNDCVLKM